MVARRIFEKSRLSEPVVFGSGDIRSGSIDTCLNYISAGFLSHALCWAAFEKWNSFIPDYIQLNRDNVTPCYNSFTG